MFGSILRSSALSATASVAGYLLLVSLARSGSAEFASFNYAAVCGLVIVLVADVAADQVASQFMLRSAHGAEQALSAVMMLKCLIFALVLMLVGMAHLSGYWTAIPPEALYFTVPIFYLGPLFELRGRNAEFAALLAIEKLALLFTCLIYIRFRGFDDGVYILHFTMALGSALYQWRRFKWGRVPTIVSARHLASAYSALYWPVYVSLFAQAAYGHASRLIIEARLGLMVFASVSLALQTLNSLSIAQSQVDRHFRPALNLAAAAGDLPALRLLFVRYVLWYVLPLAVLATLISVLSVPIVQRLFGDPWAGAAGPMAVLSPLIVTVPILRFVDTIAVSVGAQRVTLFINVCAAVLLVTTLIMIPVTRPIGDWLRVMVAVQVMHALVGGVVAFIVVRGRSGQPHHTYPR